MDKLVRLQLPWYNTANSTNTYSEAFHAYKRLTEYLKDNEIDHSFEWDNTARYLPDRMWVEADLATVFVLKYGLKILKPT